MAEPICAAFVSDYFPRRCGIATFTHDLCEAVADRAGQDADVFAVAVNDVPEGYPYDARVRFEIREPVLEDYRLAADYLNIRQVDVACMQHEYGIFGGNCGSHVLALLRRLRRPLVTTLHTILKEPSERQLAVLKEIARYSDRLVSLSQMGKQILLDVYGLADEKVVVVPHGIPDMPFVDPNFYKDQFDVEGRRVLLTFGLLSPNKGIEYAIDALPHVVNKHHDVVYLVLGATHPAVRRESGEEYRNSLIRRAHELGVDDHVVFHNRFVELKELTEYLGSADLYVTPYVNEAQIASGTLAYALGTGKATLSTPYWYAEEMLADRRGRLVPFRDSGALAKQICDLLEHETERHAMRKRAYTFCRNMVWPEVARQYLDVFAAAREAWVDKQKRMVAVAQSSAQIDEAEQTDDLPEVDLRHLRRMTDDTGIFQHSLYSTPDRSHGYCTDDNARALIAAVMYWQQIRDESIVPLMHIYLSFLAHALDRRTRRFRNFMNYNRSWARGAGSEDSHGRALWGLGMAVALSPHESMIALATHLFMRALRVVEKFSSPRSWAFAILGVHAYLRRFSGDSEVRRCRAALSEKLYGHFTDHMSDDWPWCEPAVTYCNAKLPHALMISGMWMQRPEMIDVGRRSLQWLLDIQTNRQGTLSVIGTEGWYVRGGDKARHDQQPIEAHALLDACIEAYHVTRDRRWLDESAKAFHWFLGDNDLRTPLYDFTTGGCRDGLHADRVNENQGAESLLAWLMSLLLMHEMQTEQTLGEAAAYSEGEPRPVPRAIAPSGPVVGTRIPKHARTHRHDQ